MRRIKPLVGHSSQQGNLRCLGVRDLDAQLKHYLEVQVAVLVETITLQQLRVRRDTEVDHVPGG